MKCWRLTWRVRREFHICKRLLPATGEWIDRNQSFGFTFEGKHYTAFEGDSITSALWATGETVLGSSFKYHRPHGVLSLANHDVNILMQDGRSALTITNTTENL
jgi:sarcosine oxidase, subunit alpha